MIIKAEVIEYSDRIKVVKYETDIKDEIVNLTKINRYIKEKYNDNRLVVISEKVKNEMKRRKS